MLYTCHIQTSVDCAYTLAQLLSTRSNKYSGIVKEGPQAVLLTLGSDWDGQHCNFSFVCTVYPQDVIITLNVHTYLVLKAVHNVVG